MREKEYTSQAPADSDPWGEQDEIAWLERVNRYLELSARLWRESRAGTNPNSPTADRRR